MPSRSLALDKLDWRFLAKRSGFLLLGSLATIVLTVWVPALKDMDATWSPLIVMGLTALAELVNRFVRDNTRSLLLLLCVLVPVGIAAASQPVLVITPSGFFYLDVGSDGVPVNVTVERILDLRGGSPGPAPDQPEPPPIDTALTRQIRDLAKAVDDASGSQALALVYTQSSEAIADGLVPVTASLDAVRKATDHALGLVGTAAKWKEFRSGLSTIATERIQRGELTASKQMADFLKAVAVGLELAADGSTALDFSMVIGVTTGTNNALGIK